VEERIYLNGYEVYRKITSGTVTFERQSLHIDDDKKRVALVETKTIDSPPPTITSIIRYQYDNHLGSACLELDTSAEIITYEEYHPFGTTSYRSGSSEAEVSLKRYKYVGKERDEESGLYYYGARYYAAWLGRFVSVDPLAIERLWLTPFNYCQNNPINLVDPTGALDDDPPKGANPELYEKESDLITSNNGSKLQENPYYEEQSTSSRPKGGIKITGTKIEQKQFIGLLNQRTGNKYNIDSNGFLFNQTGKVNHITSSKQSANLSELVETAINGSNLIPIDLVKNDSSVLFDSYDSGKVDVGDILKSNEVMQAGIIAHLISERLNNPGDYSIKNRTDSNYSISHEIGKKYESTVVNAMLGQSFSMVEQRTELKLIKDTGGYIVDAYFNATSTYGDRVFEFKQGAKVTPDGRGGAKVQESSEMLSRFTRIK
jgi:RHS repeat-associated protein